MKVHVLGISALTPVPLQLACMNTSGCAEFGPLNTKEGDFQPNMCFLRNGLSYNFETCTIAIGMPETSECAEFGPLNTKESDVLAQNVFSQKQINIQL